MIESGRFEALRDPADVLLVTGESRTGLAAARSLARNGVPFVVIGGRTRGMVAASRAVRRRVVAPRAADLPEAFVEFIVGAAERTGARVVLPTADNVLRVLNSHREALAEVGLTLAAGPSIGVENVLDKRANLATARRLGIPCPEQFELEHVGQLPELLERLSFPIVLKPPEAGGAGGAHAFRFKWLVANDETELRALLAENCSTGAFPLFQELARGTNVCIYCLAAAGETIALYALKAIRRAGGHNVYREIVPPDPMLVGYTRGLLAELSWDGPAALSFFVAPDGAVRYMETNGRITGSVEAGIHAGWDIPYWVVQYFMDGVRPDPPPIAVGSRTCWRYGDLVGLLSVLHGEAWRTDREQVGRLRAVIDYASAFRPGVHADVFRLDDPLPELVEHWEWLWSAGSGSVRKTVRRLRG